MPASDHTVSVQYTSCAAPDGVSLLLEMHTVLGVELYEVCTTITAQNNFVVMGPLGDLTLRAGTSVVLGNGFTVTTNGELTVEIDPDLEVPSGPSRLGQP